MRLSQFIISSKCDDEDLYLIYNTRTTAFVTMDVDSYNKVFINRDFSDKEMNAELKNMGFIIDDDYVDFSGEWRSVNDMYIDETGYWRRPGEQYMDHSGCWRW